MGLFYTLFTMVIIFVIHSIQLEIVAKHELTLKKKKFNTIQCSVIQVVKHIVSSLCNIIQDSPNS